jgi:hypothetical protein
MKSSSGGSSSLAGVSGGSISHEDFSNSRGDVYENPSKACCSCCVKASLGLNISAVAMVGLAVVHSGSKYLVSSSSSK